MAELADGGERIRAVCSNADLRPRLLIGFWGQPHVLELVVFARVRERVLGPCPFEDLKRLSKAFSAFAIWDAIGLVSTREATTTDPENQPAMTDLIDCRGFLADPQRVAQRQNLDASADLDAASACGDS